MYKYVFFSFKKQIHGCENIVTDVQTGLMVVKKNLWISRYEIDYRCATYFFWIYIRYGCEKYK